MDRRGQEIGEELTGGVDGVQAHPELGRAPLRHVGIHLAGIAEADLEGRHLDVPARQPLQQIGAVHAPRVQQQHVPRGAALQLVQRTDERKHRSSCRERLTYVSRHFPRSRCIRRAENRSPATTMRRRYPICPTREIPWSPMVSSRSSSIAWYSGLSWTITCSHDGYWSTGKNVPENK